ncbi:MAG: mandelate racemase/muconate lactonizing enzyme family protein [Bryobacteraceae bacterium]
MKIRSVEAFAIRVPRDIGAAAGLAGSPTVLAAGQGDYRWSQVYPALYSTNFETALVKVTMESGLVGWGEAQAPLAPEVACTIVRMLLAPVLVGQDFDGSIAGIEQMWRKMYSTMRVRGQTGGFMLDAISGVDIALWDIAGKMAETPVCGLIAGQEATLHVPAYISGLAGAKKVEAARLYRDQGFTLFKLFHEADWSTLLQAVGELRGAGNRVAVDALWRLDLTNAAEVASELDPLRVHWLEAPLPPEDPLAHATLASAIETPIAIGESYRTVFELKPFFLACAMQIVQPDLGRCGITEALRIAGVASECRMKVIPHVSIAMGPQVAAAVHFAAAVPNCSLLEYNPSVLDMANRFLRGPLIVRDAGYEVPQTPGLGIEIDEAKLAAVVSRRN